MSTRASLQPAPPPRYVPTFDAFHDNVNWDKEKSQLPPNTGAKLLEACKKENWMLVDELLHVCEHVWASSVDQQASVRTAVNIQDPDTGTASLILCARESKTGFVEKIANMGGDVNIRTTDHYTALHYAAASQKEEMIKLLISFGADPTLQGGPLNQLPLHLACMRRHGALPVVQYLVMLSSEDSRIAPDKEGFLPIWRAAEKSHLHVVKDLLREQSAEQLSYQNKHHNGDTLMHYVLRKNQSDILQACLEAGAPVNARNFDGQTLLHIAALTSSKPGVELLHSYHANAELVDKYDRTPLHLAVEKGLDRMVDILTEKYPGSIHVRTKDGSTLAHIAALSGHPETVLTLLKKGVYLHMPNKSGALALHAASRTGHASVVRALLNRGARVDAKTKDGYTALHLAIEYGKPAVVETVLGAGASVHTKGGKIGETPLHIAARVPNGEQSTQLLIKSGAEVNAKLENGETALHVAARSGAMKMVQMLLHEQASPMAVGAAGETPFHAAVRACHYDIAKELLDFIVAKWDRYDAVAVVNMGNAEGETPMHFVTEVVPEMTHFPGEEIKLLHLILDYNGDPGAQTKLTLETPIHYCARYGNEQVLTVLLKSLGHSKAQAILNRQSKTGWSPLLTAAEGGHLPVVKLLLKNHARVDVFDELGKSALHIAAENGHVSLVDLLLRSKAFVNSKTKLGVTALHLASMKGHIDIVRLLVEKYDATVDALSTAMKTPLHLAAQFDQMEVCELLLTMGANPNATDHVRTLCKIFNEFLLFGYRLQHGQTCLHIAAENDHERVVQLFLKVLADKNPMNMADVRGHTIAHISAKNGSVDVMELLLSFNKEDIISTRVRGSDSTVLHVAAAGGHVQLVKMLVDAGAPVAVENSDGMTALHLAARNGHIGVIDVLKEVFSPKVSSLKNGLTALHLAAYWGQADVARELLTVVPATVRSDEPTVTTATGMEIGAEAGLTPLHLACKAGQEAIVRLLLNYPGVQVDAPADKSGYIPLHMAAVNGHIPVVGLLLSRAASRLDVPDVKGQTPLMLAATKGHLNMAALLINQGADVEVRDNNGWTALHCAAIAGYLSMVKLLCDHGANPASVSKDGKIPLCYSMHSAVSGKAEKSSAHLAVMTYLMQQKYDCFALLNDSVFLVDLMQCGRTRMQKPLFEFIKFCPSPVELALKLTKFYRDASNRDKYHAKDLVLASRFCEQIGQRLLMVSCNRHNPSDILRAVDEKEESLMDIMVNGTHKDVVALVPVQRYLTSVWYGGLELRQWQISLSFLVFLLCPPVWMVFSLPLPHHISEIPFLKLVVHVTSHLYYIILLILVFMTPFQPLYERQSLFPTPQEWLLLFWLAGNLLTELMSNEERQGLGMLRSVVLFFSACAIGLHIAAAVVEDKETQPILLYIRSQLLALACFFADVQILSYLSFHQLFGPFEIMLGDIVGDCLRFMVIFFIFLFGFTFSLSALYEDTIPNNSTYNDTAYILPMILDPWASVQLLYWAVFGLYDPWGQVPAPPNGPDFAHSLVFIWYGIYLTATMIVLINLLIAMLSDTYQRIKARSDLEWKFIRAKIIINLEKTPISPPPINLVTVTLSYALKGILLVLERRSVRRIRDSTDKLLGKDYTQASKIRRWRKSLVDDIRGSAHGLTPALKEDAPVQKLTNVAVWSEIITAYEELEDLGGFDD
ncbi:serine/threonine-protein phosphatase 6 regulatory ankyrin repeat subunit B-like isoform X2 [Paramacrobiotus metropolitanus]|uniref:serine/threonine-protein phosphatase 6 regulatory ankyrin repeat subunit B-like isoform X2 n=1 Tax=Paramacrobiotus metropolitanus TaxID=2943436 RepID=UPI0024459DDC|nr:serine/threonine-protein phosphatase 6 regulatory ankyrin repeat subunit B-like isoform X2 [Paramacrobiotus metropolitanus]